jgi:DNA processing protein
LVGARNASANGRLLAGRIAGELARAGFLVVSGLARGIDTAAHTAALDGGTLAAVAGGVDIVYPPQNQALYDEIAARGLLLSEQPPGITPQARHFPRRNRLISGLSLGVVVVEAAERSGSLITARMAGEQGREVFAVPGSPLDPRARGCNLLLRQGATLVESADDVIEVLAAQIPPAREPLGPDFLPSDNRPAPESELAATRLEIVELLGPTAVSVDELLRQCQFSAAIVSLILLELELAGRLQRHAGNRVSLAVGPE